MARTIRFAAAGALLLAAISPDLARAGIEPSPFDIAIVNRSDRIAPDSPFYMEIMYAPKIYIAVQSNDPGAPGTRVIEYDPGLKGILAGDGFTFQLDLTQVGGSITGWGFTAKMGIDPAPFNVCAMQGPAAEKPASVPILPASLLTPEYVLYAFASPGTAVGGVSMASVEAQTACPTDGAWKNHGQYVRCVAAWVGGLSVAEDEADAIVSAAATSTVGK